MRPSQPLSPDLLALAHQQEGLVSARQCDAAGLDAHRRMRHVRAGTVTALARGVLDLTPARPGGPAPDDPAAARRRTAWFGLLAYGEQQAVAVGACALALHGVAGLPTVIRPEVALPGADHRRPRAGARVRCFEAGMRVDMVGTARVADPVTALAQAVCELSRRHAVAVLDSALERGLVDADGLARTRRAARGRRGAARLHDWWDLVDGRSQSPPETWARLECVDAGIPPDALQVPVVGADGRVVARGDLGWRRADGRLLVVEMDGTGPHATPTALYRDRERQNAILAGGTTDLLRFTPADLGTATIPTAVTRWLARSGPATQGSVTSRPVDPPRMTASTQTGAAGTAPTRAADPVIGGLAVPADVRDDGVGTRTGGQEPGISPAGRPGEPVIRDVSTPPGATDDGVGGRRG